jgi:hypothetical protein
MGTIGNRWDYLTGSDDLVRSSSVAGFVAPVAAKITGSPKTSFRLCRRLLAAAIGLARFLLLQFIGHRRNLKNGAAQSKSLNATTA